MKKEFASYDELQEFVDPLIKEDKWFIDVRRVTDDKYTVEWREHLKYTAHGDGKEYRDEIWLTEDMRALFIQEIPEEHCRNILRMLLRQDREKQAMVEKLIEQIAGLDVDTDIQGIDSEDEAEEFFKLLDGDTGPKRILH